jgi:hypothetical protein
MLAICAALWWEMSPVLDAVGKVRRVPHAGVRVWQPVDPDLALLLFRTGVGPEKAAAATLSVLRAHPVAAILNTGCAGALVDGLQPGALVIPDACHAPGEEHRVDAAMADRLLRAAAAAGMGFDPGPLFTSPVPLATLPQKLDARRRWGATAVEMEGAGVACVARDHGVPFAAARSILDPLLLDLPIVEQSGNMHGLSDRLKLSLKTLGRPGQISSLVRVAAAAGTVRASLRRLFDAFVRLPPQSPSQ